MNVQELIDMLTKCTDKSLPVSFSYRVAGEAENGDMIDVERVSVCQDGVVLDC